MPSPHDRRPRPPRAPRTPAPPPPEPQDSPSSCWPRAAPPRRPTRPTRPARPAGRPPRRRRTAPRRPGRGRRLPGDRRQLRVPGHRRGAAASGSSPSSRAPPRCCSPSAWRTGSSARLPRRPVRPTPWPTRAPTCRCSPTGRRGPRRSSRVEPDLVYAGWESNFSAESAGERAALADLGVASYVSPSACKAEELPARPADLRRRLRRDPRGGRRCSGPRTPPRRSSPSSAPPSPRSTPDDRGLTALWYSSGADVPYVGAGIGAPQMIMDAVGLDEHRRRRARHLDRVRLRAGRRGRPGRHRPGRRRLEHRREQDRASSRRTPPRPGSPRCARAATSPSRSPRPRPACATSTPRGTSPSSSPRWSSSRDADGRTAPVRRAAGPRRGRSGRVRRDAPPAGAARRAAPASRGPRRDVGLLALGGTPVRPARRERRRRRVPRSCCSAAPWCSSWSRSSWPSRSGRRRSVRSTCGGRSRRTPGWAPRR